MGPKRKADDNSGEQDPKKTQVATKESAPKSAFEQWSEESEKRSVMMEERGLPNSIFVERWMGEVDEETNVPVGGTLEQYRKSLVCLYVPDSLVEKEKHHSMALMVADQRPGYGANPDASEGDDADEESWRKSLMEDPLQNLEARIAVGLAEQESGNLSCIMYNTHSGNCMLDVLEHFLGDLKKRVDKLAKVKPAPPDNRYEDCIDRDVTIAKLH